MKKALSAISIFSLLLLAEKNVQAQIACMPFDVYLWQQGMPNTDNTDKFPFDETEGNFKSSTCAFLPVPRALCSGEQCRALMVLDTTCRKERISPPLAGCRRGIENSE